jgi:hypothetical protein
MLTNNRKQKLSEKNNHIKYNRNCALDNFNPIFSMSVIDE